MVRDLPTDDDAPATVPGKLPRVPAWRLWRVAADRPHSFHRLSSGVAALPPEEAEAVAALAAEINGNPGLADSYRPDTPPSPSSRLAEILRFVERAAGDPRAVRCADVRGLRAAGLGRNEIAALARLVALVAYEAQILSTIWDAGDGR